MISEEFVVGNEEGRYQLTSSGFLVDSFFGNHDIVFIMIGDVPNRTSFTQNKGKRSLGLSSFGTILSGTVITVFAK